MSNRVLDELREMGKTDVLSFATTRHETRLQAERELLAAAYQWAVLHNPDALAPFSKRAADRARPAGAAGTPLITEYAAAAFGARIQTTPSARNGSSPMRWTSTTASPASRPGSLRGRSGSGTPGMSRPRRAT
ncbi:hypothetical protein ACFQ0K_09070 [Nocardioides caeni]|uniref:hypothetical protein n=1 Tax=Nocardioides caeni TaxID=574700 RepID=UPI0031EA18CB